VVTEAMKRKETKFQKLSKTLARLKEVVLLHPSKHVYHVN
jgi:hypothetical protein